MGNQSTEFNFSGPSLVLVKILTFVILEITAPSI